LRVGKALANGSLYALLLLGSQAAAVNESLHCIEQFEPILQRGFHYWLPAIIALLSGEESPFAAYVLDVHLQLYAIFRDTLPTDFGFGHRAGRIMAEG
jgi:hypothetical protein